MGDFVSVPTVFRQAKAILGESLFFDGGDALYWCDITAGVVHRSPLDGAADGSADETFALPAPVASFHPALIGGVGEPRDTAAPGFVVSLGDRIVLTDSTFTIVRELATVQHAHASLRLNEGKV